MSDEPPKDVTPRVGELVRQKHGGALKHGGRHPSAGRPPSQIKADCRADFDKMREDLKKLFYSKKKTLKDYDRIRIVELFAKYGMDEGMNRTDVAHAIQGTVLDIRTFLAPLVAEEQIDALLSVIRQRWRPLW